MESDSEFENRIRPQELDNFRGQEKVAENLRVFIRAALMRGDSLDHVLLHGPPGLGKTTLANIIANEMGSTLRVTSGPVLDKPGDLAGLLTNLNAGDVLFIDEIHRLSPIIEEYLYSAMEDYRIDIVLDKGPSARSIQLELNPFTLIGATTRSGLLTSPLRARFGIQCHLEYYDTDVLTGIVKRSASILSIDIDDDAAQEVALRSRGTPRIANSLLRRVRDFAMVKGDGVIDLPITRTALKALDIDSRGLDQMDNKILSTIIHKFGGGPVGINTIATAVSEDAGTIEEAYTLMGLTYVQTGKDLTQTQNLVVTGGSLIHTQQTSKIASYALYDPAQPMSLRPKKAQVLVDRQYILSAMGLLAASHPACALRIMKKEIKVDGDPK